MGSQSPMDVRDVANALPVLVVEEGVNGRTMVMARKSGNRQRPLTVLQASPCSDCSTLDTARLPPK